MERRLARLPVFNAISLQETKKLQKTKPLILFALEILFDSRPHIFSEKKSK